MSSSNATSTFSKDALKDNSERINGKSKSFVARISQEFQGMLSDLDGNPRFLGRYAGRSLSPSSLCGKESEINEKEILKSLSNIYSDIMENKAVKASKTAISASGITKSIPLSPHEKKIENPVKIHDSELRRVRDSLKLSSNTVLSRPKSIFLGEHSAITHLKEIFTFPESLLYNDSTFKIKENVEEQKSQDEVMFIELNELKAKMKEIEKKLDAVFLTNCKKREALTQKYAFIESRLEELKKRDILSASSQEKNNAAAESIMQEKTFLNAILERSESKLWTLICLFVMFILLLIASIRDWCHPVFRLVSDLIITL